MQENAIKALHRENYTVPKGEERAVHYLIEKVAHDKTTGRRISTPILRKTGVKMFEMVKRNLELQGYTLEILHHPQGLYTTTRIPDDPVQIMAAKDEEIERLRRELEEVKKNLPAEKEQETENPEPKSDGKSEKGEVESEENTEKAPAGKKEGAKKTAKKK